MRSPDGDASPSSISLRRQLLRQYFRQVPIGGQNLQIRHRNSGGGIGDGVASSTSGGQHYSLTLVLIIVPLLGSRRRRRRFRAGFLGRREEVNLAALELGVGRDDDDLGDDGAVVVGGGGGGFLEDVLGIGVHDVTCGDGAGDLLDAAVGMDDSDDIECAAWKNARDATPYAVLHY